MAEQASTDDELKQHHMLSGEVAYEQAINDVIGHAQRNLRIFDIDLAKGGYSGLKRYDALRDFLMRSRANRLVIVLHETEYLTQRCPRLMNLLKIHSHAISILQTSDHARAANNPFVIADETHYVHRFHNSGARFLLAIHDPIGARQLEERFGHLLEGARPAAFANATGL